MMIDFDPNKNARNIQERGLSFLAAARIYLGNTVEADDDRKDYGKRRIQSVGQADGFWPGLCMMELGPQILSLSGKGLRVDRSSSKSCTMCKFFTFCLEVKGAA